MKDECDIDILSDILARMKMVGTLYFRTAFTSPWGVRVPAFENVARFHFAHRGRCFVRITGTQDDSVPDLVALEQGDLIIIMRGTGHTLFCDPSTEHSAMRLEDIVERSGFTGTGALVYGEPGTGFETQLICGHFAFDDQASHPLIDALPPYIHIANYGEQTGGWMEGTLKIIGTEAGRHNPGGDLIALKLSEIIFAQALRAYLSASGDRMPILAGFSDDKLARALKKIHQNPANAWTLDQLAREANMSRTSFANKFVRKLSLTHMAYLTMWRMQVARQSLIDSARPILDVAESVGYHSEAAFGRAFKKAFNLSPARFRRRHLVISAAQ